MIIIVLAINLVVSLCSIVFAVYLLHEVQTLRTQLQQGGQIATPQQPPILPDPPRAPIGFRTT